MHLLSASENKLQVGKLRYSRIEYLGEGSFGTVVLAHTLDKAKKLVAIKVSKPGHLELFKKERRVFRALKKANKGEPCNHIIGLLGHGIVEGTRSYGLVSSSLLQLARVLKLGPQIFEYSEITLTDYSQHMRPLCYGFEWIMTIAQQVSVSEFLREVMLIA